MTDTNEQFGYDLIRNDILRDLLGEDHDPILYWAGKSLARKYPLESIDDVTHFFAKANWGELSQVKERRKSFTFELTGEWMGKADHRSYELEAGFLSQQIEHIVQVISGATYVQKKNQVVFTIEVDRHDSI